MIFNAENGRLHLKTGSMDYIRFGRGNRVMILLPGVGDGLKTVKGMAFPFAVLYRKLTKDFTVYSFSRRTELHDHMTTREMAEDLNEAIELLGLPKAVVVGVSQGGMISEWLAIDHPEKVYKLVLVVTTARSNKVLDEAVSGWQDMALSGDYKGIMIDTAERSYSPKRLKTARLEYKLLGSFGKPKSFRRFMIQAESCVTHDAADELCKITCPTLVIGGKEDRIATGEASEEIADLIPGSMLHMYEGLGHGLYEEAPDFLERIMDFCK